jgi:quercetin dioxygenase-like cupin family protein
MKVVARAASEHGSPMEPPDNFSGPATNHVFGTITGAPSVMVHLVHFEAGSRNNWHRHSTGQVLHITEGHGFVQARGEEIRAVSAGDTVVIGGGEEHWHGAGPAAAMAHFAVTAGDAEWLEPSELG